MVNKVEFVSDEEILMVERIKSSRDVFISRVFLILVKKVNMVEI